MSKGDWRLYASLGIAVGIVALGVLGHEWDARHYYETPKTEQAIAQGDVADTVALSAFDQGPNSDSQQQAAPDHDTRTVWAAEDAAYWTMMAAIVGAAGALVVAFSLIYSARATQAALDAAKHARDTLDANRAWMTIDQIVAYWDLNQANEKIVQSITISWENTGQSPATNVYFDLSNPMIIAPLAEGQVPAMPPMRTDSIIGRGIVGPGKSVSTVHCKITPQHYRDIVASRMRMYIACRINYNDIFKPGEQRFTEMFVQVYFRLLADGNTFTPNAAMSPVGDQGYN